MIDLVKAMLTFLFVVVCIFIPWLVGSVVCFDIMNNHLKISIEVIK